MIFRILFLLLIPIPFVHAQKKMQKLEKEMVQIIQGFNGDIGFYLQDLKTGKSFGYHADTIFPTASIVKVPILVGVMDKINKGELNYHQQLIYRDSLLYEGEDVLGAFKDSAKVELSKVMMLMLTLSDNTASLWLQSLAGTGTRINELMSGLGLTHTRVNSRTPGREANRTLYGWGQTTPQEMATLFKMISQHKVIGYEAGERMLRLLGRNHWDEDAQAVIPAGVFIADKNGAVNASRSEVMLVKAKRPYIISIFTKNNKDQSWNSDNEAWVLTRRLSAIAWEHFSK